MAEVLSIISIVSFVLAGVFLILAVFFWIKFGIPKIIGDLTGRTAKASIAKMRENNEKTGVKSFKPSAGNIERGKLTETASGFNEEATEKLDSSSIQPETGILSDNKAEAEADAPETDLLDAGTALLDEKEPITPIVHTNSSNIKIKDEITFIHTDEVI